MKRQLLTIITVLLCVCVLSACRDAGGAESENGGKADLSTLFERLTEDDTETGTEKETESEAVAGEQSFTERVGGKLYIGDVFTLGTYEQDNNIANGAEDIEWIVYKKIDDKTYKCISKYVLDSRAFLEDKGSYSVYEGAGTVINNWGGSDLRRWLNNDFYNTAFSDTDKNVIVASNNSVYEWADLKASSLSKGTYEDKVCLINWGESVASDVNGEFFCVKVTPYAQAQGARTVGDGTREHDDCSYDWIGMSINKERAERAISNYKANPSPDYSVVTGARGDTLSVWCWMHDRDNSVASAFSSKNHNPGVRPVITVELD